MVVAPVDQYVFLLGRPPLGEFLGFITTMAVDGQKADQGLLTEEWRQANDHVVSLEQLEAGMADNPPIVPLPPGIRTLAERVTADPMFRKAYRFVPASFAMVELDRLVVFQKFINLGYIQALKQGLGPHPTEEQVARLALGIDRPLPHVQAMQNAGNIYSFISPSNDFRFLEGALISPDQVTGFVSTGRPFAYLLLGIGYGSNYLNALHVEGRLVLNNGSHRAYALRELGLSHAPCLVQSVTRREELEIVASGDVLQNPDRYLKTRRPPLLKDYFDAHLRKVVRVPKKNRIVRVQFQVEQSDVPAS
ncbi:MAG TPA: hypothetical protein VN375_16035 [Vicinamibacteria bacterium]|jgi:hypothetical protein|nr:hypothetical protein [Vicinamibacteria bacterium]